MPGLIRYSLIYSLSRCFFTTKDTKITKRMTDANDQIGLVGHWCLVISCFVFFVHFVVRLEIEFGESVRRYRRRMDANQDLGPFSENVMPVNFGLVSKRVGSIDSICQPAAKAASSSARVMRRGPNSPGSSSLKHRRNRRPPGLRTGARPST